ncbi:MAG: DNA polymerase III subunit alpha [Spirochaetales bacterium]|nr:DNA polymerase III subunit alpha [Spirochaetales bacterium]
MPEFVHLHNHSDYSLLDGAASISGLVNKARKLGMKHLALTDHGNMFGVLRFYKACRAAEINPIIGCEFYVSPESRHTKSPNDSGEKYNHLILLAKNEQGYRNLMELTSLAYLEGFYYKPRIDRELLEQYSDNLICLSACLAGAIPRALLAGNMNAAREKALYYERVFGKGNFYLELQDHGIAEQKIVNKGLRELSARTGIPLVATNDIHYLEKDHAEAQDILICIGTNRKLSDTNRMSFKTREFYFKTDSEMAALFPDCLEAIANTVKIAEQCRLEINLPGPVLPEYVIPDEFASPEDYVRHITYKGLESLYPEITPAIRERAEYELDLIFKMNFAGYFLIVWDFIDFARRNGIPVGPGRGSCVGSIVSYGMRITDVDPLKYNLLFERFLNPERISMPDVDIDFCFEGRSKVIDYVTQKYGVDKVASICTFGTLKTKAVLKDVARVLDIPFAESNQISKLVPEGPKINLEKALEMEPKLKEYDSRGGTYGQLISASKILEGLNRHVSTHACGMVIGQKKLTNYVPLYKDPKTGQVSTEFTMDQLEECGLVKMDFLGLKTLTLISNTEKLIRKEIPEFDIEKIPDDDPVTFAMLGEGKSTAVFQFESSGMQGILRRAKPNSIEDLIALNALYRPGPMQYIPQFIDSKMGRQRIVYPDPSLEFVLKPTYGVIVYQEQVMEVARIIGGFSLGKADILRRAMGKKKLKEMEKMKVEFLDGAVERGYTAKKAGEIFDMLIPFADYGFNKSHAAAYSILAYQTAYLKANFPAEFMAANLTNEVSSPDTFKDYITSIRNMGIEVLPPDINISEKTFTVVGGKISYGLIGIKNVGSASVDEIIAQRERAGAYTSFMDFLEKVDLKTVNRKVIETFIRAGLFDSMGINRATLMYNLDKALEFMNRKKEQSRYGQSSLFADEDIPELANVQLEEMPEWDKLEILRLEKENLGFYFSGHPLDSYRALWEKAANLDLSRVERASGEKAYTVLGLLKSIKQIITKKGKQMAFGTIEDFNGSIELTFFSDIWEQCRDKVSTDMVLAVKGKIDTSRGEPQMIVEELPDPETLKENAVSEIHIRLDGTLDREEELSELRAILLDNQGSCPVYLHLENIEGETVVRASAQLTVSPSKTLFRKIDEFPKVLEIWKE